ncbi:MAG: ComEC family competence protein [Bacteroidetes bacterium]|nr:ComEC family competence protein [Bacteroidota bacterium]
MFERFLHQTPFFRLLVPFILGIVFQIKFSFWAKYNLIFLSGLLIVILIFAAFRLTRHFSFNKIWGVLISLFLFVLGIQLVIFKQQKENYFEEKEHTFIATLTESPTEKENSVKAVLKVKSIKDSAIWKTTNSLLICYFEKDSATLNLSLGDQIIANAYINEIKHTGNPYAFNYKRYLSFKEIYNQSYIEKEKFRVIAKNKGSKLKLLSNKTRQQLLKIYEQNNIQGDEFAVLSALTLGYKDELTPELKESFSTSGAMHILAVSGLHVGIIYIILCKLLFFLEKNRYGKVLRSLITISMLFFYAFLTGLSDSVMRATIMFSFISFGNVFTRQMNIYNSIAASAFILLLYNPYSVMSVGFQLSYAAVLSIVFFQPKIYSLLNFNKKIPDYIWQLVSVAIAAQIGTFPITVHYFNQFPAYFIVTNIIIIPLATLVIYGALILFIFSFSKMISSIIAKLINFFLIALNSSINFIENLPGSNISGLLVDKTEVFILLAFILTLSFFILSKRTQHLYLTILFFIGFTLYNITLQEVNSRKSMFIVHHTPKMSAIQLISHSKAFFLHNHQVAEDDNNIRFNILPVREHLHIDNQYVTEKLLWKPINYFSLNNQRFVQIKDIYFLQYKPVNKLKTDYIILSENIKVSIPELLNYFEFERIIFDTSNSYYTINRWEKECTENKIEYINVINDGAYIEYL